MKIICPVCELFLVELEVDGGFVSFFCARCESKRLDMDSRLFAFKTCATLKPCYIRQKPLEARDKKAVSF